jgi:hypothetical protein
MWALERVYCRPEGEIMAVSNELMQELAALIEETGERIAEDYYFAFFEFLAKINLSDNDCPIPLKLWTAIAQALADASGYRISLQAVMLEPINGEPGSYGFVGHREAASVEPTLFVQQAED